MTPLQIWTIFSSALAQFTMEQLYLCAVCLCKKHPLSEQIIRAMYYIEYVSIKKRKHEKRDFQCKYQRANIYSMAFAMFFHGINFFLYWSVTNNFRIKYSMNKCTFCVCFGVSGSVYVGCPVVFGRISPFEGCQYSLQMTCQWFW